MEKKDNQLKLHGLSVVNGCQSLNTILSCSEKVKTLEDTYVLFRFYEIPQRDRADRISINTNSQSAVKPRDLRSNDKRVLNIKKQFEQKYPPVSYTHLDVYKRQILDKARQYGGAIYFYTCIIENGIWAELKPRAKVLYLTLRAVAKQDLELYSVIEGEDRCV